MLPLRMVAVKNSMKRLAAWSPAWAMIAGRSGPPLPAETLPLDALTISDCMHAPA